MRRGRSPGHAPQAPAVIMGLVSPSQHLGHDHDWRRREGARGGIAGTVAGGSGGQGGDDGGDQRVRNGRWQHDAGVRSRTPSSS